MQTFLPSRSFERSARLLDSKRLGKQRVEVLQILRSLHLEDYGWRNHPAVCMWRGCTDALVSYGVEVTREWLRRGYADTVLAQLIEFASRGRPRSQRQLAARGALPPWLGSLRLHRSHRSALVRKHPAHYGPLFGGVPDDLPYYWPSSRPAPERPLERFSAWVVRPYAPGALERFRDRGIVALPELAPDARGEDGTRTKAGRQIAAFRSLPQVGDGVLVPLADGSIAIGEISGGYRREARAVAPHVRDVRWSDATLARTAMALPGRLQDPRLFFALRGERDPRELFSEPASRAVRPRRRTSR